MPERNGTDLLYTNAPLIFTTLTKDNKQECTVLKGVYGSVPAESRDS